MVEIISPQLNNEILQELTPCSKTSYCCNIAVLIKILFKSDRFFKFQNFVKLSNSFRYKLEGGGAYIRGGGAYNWMCFFFCL